MYQKLKQFIQRFLKKDLIKNTLQLASGSIFAQAVAIAMIPILYRIYTREDYGVLGLFMATVWVLGVFVTLQYDQAIIIEENEENMAQAELLELSEIEPVSLIDDPNLERIYTEHFEEYLQRADHVINL